VLASPGQPGGTGAAGTAVTREQGRDDAQATAALGAERHLRQRIGEQLRYGGVIVAAIGHRERHGASRNGDVQLVWAGGVQAGVDDQLLDRKLRIAAPVRADL
jgi:hypothetical protein